mgnify:CR=1 FL=1
MSIFSCIVKWYAQSQRTIGNIPFFILHYTHDSELYLPMLLKVRFNFCVLLTLRSVLKIFLLSPHFTNTMIAVNLCLITGRKRRNFSIGTNATKAISCFTWTMQLSKVYMGTLTTTKCWIKHAYPVTKRLFAELFVRNVVIRRIINFIVRIAGSLLAPNRLVFTVILLTRSKSCIEQVLSVISVGLLLICWDLLLSGTQLVTLIFARFALSICLRNMNWFLSILRKMWWIIWLFPKFRISFNLITIVLTLMMITFISLSCQWYPSQSMSKISSLMGSIITLRRTWKKRKIMFKMRPLWTILKLNQFRMRFRKICNQISLNKIMCQSFKHTLNLCISIVQTLIFETISLF